MPDEIIPRDRAELLWDAIINHTIEAVDAIRDRPELIAAAIAAGLPDMLGNPRDRYEMFLKAIAGAQGGNGWAELKNMNSPSFKWRTGTFNTSLNDGAVLEVTFIDSGDSPTYSNILSFGDPSKLEQWTNTTALQVYHDKGNNKLVFRMSGQETAVAIDRTVQHTIKVDKDNFYLDNEIVRSTPSSLSEFVGIAVGCAEGNTRSNVTYLSVSLK